MTRKSTTHVFGRKAQLCSSVNMRTYDSKQEFVRKISILRSLCKENECEQ
jgi:hypothetical protein